MLYLYRLFIVFVNILVLFLQNIEIDGFFLWLVSIFKLHSILPTTVQTSGIDVQVNVSGYDPYFIDYIHYSTYIVYIYICILCIYILTITVFSSFRNSDCMVSVFEIVIDDIIWRLIHIHGFL